MATDSDMIKKMDQMSKALEAMANKPYTNAGKALGGWTPNPTGAWPAERLKALGAAYGDSSCVDMFTKKHNGKQRLSGIGPALVRLAAMNAEPGSGVRQIAMSQGMPSDYNQDSLEKQYGFTSIAKAAKFGIKGLNGEVRKTALAEGSGQTGGYIVPPQFLNELLTIAGEDGFIEQRAKVIPMNSRTAQWPMLDVTTVQATGTTPYAGGVLAQWQPEAASINESEPAFKQSEWTAWDLELYAVSSNQLLADNGIGLDALLTQLFGWALTWYKEYAFLRGSGAGSSMPLGIINAPATLVQNRAVSGRFVLTDAAAMLSHLQVRSWDDACWIMHQSVIPQLIQMVGGGTSNTASSTYIPGNQLVWVNPMPPGDSGPMSMKLPNAFLNGLPVYFTEKVPTLGTKGDVMLVDWSKYVIGQRMDMQIDVSPHYLFRNNQLAWRVIARCDGKPWLNSYITDAEGWTVSPMVVLNT